jgi:hypothetical protein
VYEESDTLTIVYQRGFADGKRAAQRRPLTDEQITKCYETSGHSQELRAQDRFAVLSFARAIEAAHNIKEET